MRKPPGAKNIGESSGEEGEDDSPPRGDKLNLRKSGMSTPDFTWSSETAYIASPVLELMLTILVSFPVILRTKYFIVAAPRTAKWLGMTF